jgi:hypothetical protein
MSDWYIQVEESENLGPFGPSELLSMVRSGDVTRESVIRKHNTGWYAASDVGGLFEAAMRPTIEYLCPQCETEVSEPPVVCDHCGRKIRHALTKITEHSIIIKSE